MRESERKTEHQYEKQLDEKVTECYFRRCFIRPSRVPGNSDLSPHLHSKSLLLLKLLLLQNGATKMTDNTSSEI